MPWYVSHCRKLYLGTLPSRLHVKKQEKLSQTITDRIKAFGADRSTFFIVHYSKGHILSPNVKSMTKPHKPNHNQTFTTSSPTTAMRDVSGLPVTR